MKLIVHVDCKLEFCFLLSCKSNQLRCHCGGKFWCLVAAAAALILYVVGWSQKQCSGVRGSGECAMGKVAERALECRG